MLVVHEVDLNFVRTGGNVTLKVPRKTLCSKCNGVGGETAECPTCKGAGVTVNVMSGTILQTICGNCRGNGKKIVKKCNNCQNGSIAGEEYTIECPIPAGVEHGMRFSMPGEGDPSPSGRGELIVEIAVKPHPYIMRLPDGMLLTQVPITLTQLVKGGKVDVATLNEVVSLAIPKGTQSGTKFRLRGQGLPRMLVQGTRYQYQDLIVEVKLETPDLSKQKNLLEQLEKVESKIITPMRAQYQKYVEEKYELGRTEKK